MVIKGIEKITLIDYPGHIASTIFLGGCNFRCDYCYNKDLVVRPHALPNISEEVILSTLSSRRHFIEGVVITGGEPMVQAAHLMEFIPRIRSLGLKIKLDTNGYFPDKIRQLVDAGLIDYLAMDIKAPLTRYAEITGVEIITQQIERSVQLLMSCGVAYEFRTTVWKNGFSHDDFLQMVTLIRGAEKYFLQNMYPFFTIQPKKEYRAMKKADIEPVVQLAKQYVQSVSLRGEW